MLVIPIEFESNRGLSQVVPIVPISSNPDDFSVSSNSLKQDTNKISIQCQRLDDYLSVDDSIDLMKVDVEGHELAVFEGASRCLELHQIRHILFEDHEHYPNSVSNFLEDKGYTILAIDRQLFSPKIVLPSTKNSITWLPNSYLATCDPQDIFNSFKKSGYQIFESKT